MTSILSRGKTVIASMMLLWLPFGTACLLVPAIALAGLLVWLATGKGYDYTKNLLGGMDRCTSGLLGLDSRYTVSAHCGAMTRAWLRPLRAGLDVIAPGHCAGAAIHENLT